MKSDVRKQLLSIEPVVKPFGAVEFEVKFPVVGSFFYQIEYFDVELEETNVTHPDWIVVNPYLYTTNIIFPIESLSLQTVLSRCLGKLKDWPQVIEAQSKLGYNAIHFLPIQAYGKSGNMYSIKDQLSIDDCYFEHTKISTDERISKVKEVINKISEEQNIVCFIDVVLNHTAVNSDWLLEHPEAAYNLHNSPHFNVAWEFDKFLMDFSQAFSRREVAECPNAPYIANKRDLQAVMKALKGRVQSIPLYQYFMYDKETVRKQFEEALEVIDEAELSKLKAIEVNIVNYIINHSHGYGYKPFGVTLDVHKVGAMMRAKSLSNRENLWKELNEHLDNCNAI
jgi:glycogen debranching enzyme